MVECPHQPLNELLTYHRKTQFMCDREHKLEFLDKMPSDMTDPICMDCSATENVKSLCYVCGTMYCNKCRIPQYTQRGCPANHKYKMEMADTIRCSICNLAAAYVNLPTYVDIECQFKICELCFHKLPKMSEAQLKLCRNGHELFILPQLVNETCYGCNRNTLCWKECQRCGDFACLRCERR